MARHGWPASRPRFEEPPSPLVLPERDEVITRMRSLWKIPWGVLALRSVDPAEPRIFEIGLVDAGGNILLHEYIDPGIPLGSESALRDSDVVGGIRWPGARGKLNWALREFGIEVMLSFRATNDSHVLNYNDGLWGQHPPLEVLSVQAMATAFVADRGGLNLADACRQLGIPDGDLAGAVDEACATVALVETLFVSW